MSAQDHPLRRFGVVTTAGFEIDWNAVYQRELPRIYNYFRYRLGNDQIAQDLCSATFEKAWRARDRYRRDLAGFSTWLFTIARNLATDHLRSHRTTLSLDDIHDQAAPDSPHDIFARDAEIQRLGVLLAQLSDRERELVALKYGAQFNNREIARQLRLSESNVGTILHRIVGKLREQWNE